MQSAKKFCWWLENWKNYKTRDWWSCNKIIKRNCSAKNNRWIYEIRSYKQKVVLLFVNSELIEFYLRKTLYFVSKCIRSYFINTIYPLNLLRKFGMARIVWNIVLWPIKFLSYNKLEKCLLNEKPEIDRSINFNRYSISLLQAMWDNLF